MMRFLLFVSLLAGCTRSVFVDGEQATQVPVVATEASVRTVLATRHFDADSPAVRALGEAAGPELVALAESATEPNAVRIRATLAMRHQHGADVEQSLLRLATTAELPALRRASVDSLSRAFGATDPETVIATCQALASHPAASVRQAATEAEMRARVAGRRRHP